MGIDIFGFFQAKSGDSWRYICKYDYHQRGALKLWLAPWNPGSRGIEPIAPWRNRPSDTKHDGHGVAGSWLLADEILDALPLIEKWSTTLSEQEFEVKRHQSYWDSVDASVDRDPIKLISVIRKPCQLTTSTASVEVEFLFDIGEEIKEFIDLVRELKRKYGDVRYVFEYV